MAVLIAISPQQLLAVEGRGVIAQELFSELRCPICNAQPLIESDTALAASMRNVIEEKVQAGESKQEILVFLEKRYGQKIYLSPPLAKQSLLLFILPIMLGGLIFSFWFLKYLKRG